MTVLGENLSTMRYAFIDAGHLFLHRDDDMRAFFTFAPRLDLERLLVDADIQKAFVYDAIDERPPDEDPLKQAARVEKANQRKAFLDEVQKTRRCHVRYGSTAGSRVLRQKEVDVLLTTEALMHRVRGNFTDVIIVAGDRDFRPLVDALVQLGAQTEVWSCLGHHSEDLLNAADTQRKISIADYVRWTDDVFKAMNPYPTESHQPHRHTPNTTLLRSGVVLSRQLEVRRGPEEWQAHERFIAILQGENSSRPHLWVRFGDLERLYSWLELRFPVEWKV